MKANFVMVYLWLGLDGFVVYVTDLLCMPRLAHSFIIYGFNILRYQNNPLCVYMLRKYAIHLQWNGSILCE